MRLNEDFGEVGIVVAGGDHVKTHQDVEGQGEHWQIPAAVNRCQGTRHNRAEKKDNIISVHAHLIEAVI